MTHSTDPERGERKEAKLIGLVMTMPFALSLPPIVGWYLGTWIDKHWGTAPYAMWTLLVLGFVAGARECYRIIKKYADDDGEGDIRR